ncbi:MAG: hypothetical protein ACOC4M_13250, partial [Promethearchaeia archaeon]
PPGTRTENPHIRQHTLEANGIFLDLDPDFEGEFNITEAEYDYDGNKIHKPYYAYQQFFEIDGTPKEDELDIVKSHPKLATIFRAIYDLDLA